MKQLKVSEGIVPLGEFKSKAAALLRDLKGRSGPIVITRNGRPAAVMMAPEAYDRLQEQQRFLEAVAQGLSDAAAGRVVDHAKVSEWLARWGTDDETEPPL